MLGRPDDSDGIVRRPTRVLAAASRYDLVLAVIPLAFAVGALASGLPTVSTDLGVGGGGVVALAATAYALFGDPPAGPGSGRNRPGAPGAR